MRGRLLCGVVVMVASCASAPPQTTTTTTAAATMPAAAARDTPAANIDAWRARPADSACLTALENLVHGELAAYSGLGACGRIDAEKVLGSSGDQPSRFEQLGEYRTYPHASGTVFVWFLRDEIRVLQLLHPRLGRPLRAQLGEPDRKIPSKLSAKWEQWIYARRGLAAHVDRSTNEPMTVYAFRPTSVDEFLQSDLAQVAKSEAPLEVLH